MAQGFRKVPGRDCDETWAPVPNAATIRTLFSVAASKICEVDNVDVKIAYLKAEMGHTVYSELPSLFSHNHPDTVCRLNMALYGIKRAGRL